MRVNRISGSNCWPRNQIVSVPCGEQPADEPCQSRDLELGHGLKAWAEVHAASLDLELGSRLDGRAGPNLDGRGRSVTT